MTALLMIEDKCNLVTIDKNWTFRPIFSHFQESKKLKELAYICVRYRNVLRTIKDVENVKKLS